MGRAYEIIANLDIDVDAVEKARKELPRPRKRIRRRPA